MAQQVYECLFILDSNRYAKDPGGVAASIPEMIEKLEGSVLVSRLWNEQKLAYPIDGHKKGTYWLTYFQMESTHMPQFVRACQLNANILRHLAIRPPEKLVETLVAHAKGERQAEPEEVVETAESQ